MNNKGISLVEVLIAGAMIAAALASASFLVGAAGRGGADSHLLTKSLFCAREKMEEMRQVPFSSLSAFNGASFGGGKGRVEVRDISGDLKEIKVERAWKDGRRPIVLHTLRSGY